MLLKRQDSPLLDSINHWLQTPTSLAVQKGSKAVEKVLQDAGGQLMCGMHKDVYPLHGAALVGDVGERSFLTSDVAWDSPCGRCG